jgi:hypothetical protein
MIYPLTSVHARYREFDNTMWADVKNNPPKYIVASMDIPSSIAWDGEADLEIIRNLCGLLAQDYQIERKMPILDRDPSPDDTNTLPVDR